MERGYNNTIGYSSHKTLGSTIEFKKLHLWNTIELSSKNSNMDKIGNLKSKLRGSQLNLNEEYKKSGVNSIFKSVRLNIEIKRSLFSKYKELYKEAEIARLALREAAIGCKVLDESNREKLIIHFFDMMCYIVNVPFTKIDIYLEAYQILGDIFLKINEYKNALIYYYEAVFFIYS